jgi:mannosyl-glycoprotein endo-beta-N-acetylglucosaminidase
MSKPSGFVMNGTTYVPIWYVGQALSKIGVSTTWKNHVLNLTVPSSMNPQIVPASSQTGDIKIAINGTVVASCSGVVNIDPASKQLTEYLPIWYLIEALKQIHVSSKWDGTNWNMTWSPSTIVALATSSFSTKSIYLNGKLISKPGGFVQNGTTYIPIWYVGAALSQAGISNTWQNGVFNFTLPSSMNPKITPVASPTGSVKIAINGQVVASCDGISAVDPASNQSTQYLPIWYVMQAMNQILTSKWDGTNWYLTLSPSTSSSGSTSGSSTSGSSTSGSSTSGSSPSTPPQTQTGTFPNVDLRYAAPTDITASSIDDYLQSHSSPMTGLGQTFVNSQNIYGVDANYLVSHAILESYWGKSQIAQTKNNLFGYGAYDSAPGQDAGLFPSEEYAILFQGWEVRNNYLTPGSSLYVSPTLKGMNVNYATDQQWASSIGSLMNQMASYVGDNVSSYTQYQPSNQPPAPESTQEPVFYTQASAAVQTVPNYGGLPYYSSPGAGASQMYFGTLQSGSFGASVAAIQSYLNQTMNAGLTVDGQFGPLTKQAVIAFQAAHGLAQTGEWTFPMWQMFNQAPPTLPPGQTVTVSQIAMGMANGIVIEWDYVQGYGWVDSQYLQLLNVYRAIAVQPQSTNTTIHVYGPDKQTVIQTIHSGYFVVSNAPTPQGGFVPVEVCDESTGQLLQGYISTAEANLVQVQ